MKFSYDNSRAECFNNLCHMEKFDCANAYWMKPFSAGCDFPLITTRAFTASMITSCSPVYLDFESIVNMNYPQFDSGVLCLSFGASLALIQYENQAKIRRSK